MGRDVLDLVQRSQVCRRAEQPGIRTHVLDSGESPSDDAAAESTYCLAHTGTGAEYLAFFDSRFGSVNLSGSTGTFVVEWFNPSTGATTLGTPVTGGSTTYFTSPYGSNSVLYLHH